MSGDAAEVYEKCFVPAILVLGAADRRRRERCPPKIECSMSATGTSVLARAAADRVADESQVTGLDLNEDVLAVARRSPLEALLNEENYED